MLVRVRSELSHRLGLFDIVAIRAMYATHAFMHTVNVNTSKPKKGRVSTRLRTIHEVEDNLVVFLPLRRKNYRQRRV